MTTSINKKYKVFIGVDPGLDTTGIAIWDVGQKKFTRMSTINYWEALSFFTENIRSDTCFVLENPNLVRPLYGAKARIMKQPVRDKINQDVGMNKAVARLYQQYLAMNEACLIVIKPTSSKKDTNTFRRITGYQKRISQHARDAGMLVFGR